MKTFIRSIARFSLCLFVFCPALLLFSSEEAAPDLAEEHSIAVPNFHALFIKTMFLVGGLLIVTAGGLYLLKKAQSRFANAKGQADIQILDRRALSPKTQLFLLSVKGQETIIVESAHQITIQPIHTPNETEKESV